MIALHSDASTEVGYGGTSGHDLRMGSDGLCHGRGIWNFSFRVTPITHLELIAVKESLRSSADLLKGHVTDFKLYEDN